MSDDIREVMRPTPFSPQKRVGNPSNRPGGEEGHAGGGEETGGEESLSEEEIALLEREVEAANDRLAAAGRDFRLNLAIADGLAAIEIFSRDAAGGESVTRTITPGEFPAWVERLESGEGLIIDETI